MFETRPTRVAPAARQQALAALRRQLDLTHPGALATATEAPPVDRAPAEAIGTVRADGEVLPLTGPLADLLPHGGLPRGGVVSVQGGPDDGDGGGASSLLLSLLAGPERAWSALVALPGIGLLAAAELGVDLERVVLVPDPGPDLLQVISVLADGVDVIAVGAGRTAPGPPARLRVLGGRLRQHGAVLLVAGPWPGADLVLTARQSGWVGIGRGHGRLQERLLTVTVDGRRLAGRSRTGSILLAGRRDGSVLQLPGMPAPQRIESTEWPAVPAAV